MRRRPGSAPEKAALQVREFYRAYRAFATTLLRPDLTLRFSLEPGDCIVFDNTRILHSRTGFTATGRRHLQGCYAAIDGAESTAAILARRHAGVHDAAAHDVAAPDAAPPEAANIDG
jgi:gamma-butyrobetaine dioxygenase